MADADALIAHLYSAFNRRHIDDALAVMSEAVDWPKASEGGRIVGKEEIRAYWTRQWADFDPHVEPLQVTERDAGTIEVKVRQRVKNRSGELLSDRVVQHVYTLRDGFVERMDINDSVPAFGQSPPPPQG